ncbi:MAG: AEC family transporter [Anaerolineae bacterium]
MTIFFSALTTIVLPILLVAAAGYLLRRTGLVTDSRPLARLSLYILSPALVLNSIARSKLSDSDVVSIIAIALLVAGVMGGLSLLLARVLRYDRLLTAAFLLSIMFVNAGNIGLPFNQFAYGQEGLSRAAVFFVANSVLSHVLAIFIASRGRKEWKDSLTAVFKMPLIYASIIGLVLNRTGWALPEALSRAVDLTSSAAVPVMLVMLGLELARVRLTESLRPVLLATGVKLIVTPVVALGLAALIGLAGLTRSVSVLEASMPTAVTVSLIAVEFDARPDFVTSVILLSTLGSTITLVILLLILGYSG